jgi:hypothetical protein
VVTAFGALDDFKLHPHERVMVHESAESLWGAAEVTNSAAYVATARVYDFLRMWRE